MPNIENFEQQLGKLKPGEKDKFLDQLIGELQADKHIGDTWNNVQQKSINQQMEVLEAEEKKMKEQQRKEQMEQEIREKVEAEEKEKYEQEFRAKIRKEQ